LSTHRPSNRQVEEAVGAWQDVRSKREAVEVGMRTLERLRQQDDLEAPTSNRTNGGCCRFLGLD
jgi:hypothetical protein